MRAPHIETWKFLLNNRLLKEKIVLKTRIRVEWEHGVVKSFWKFVTKYLFFKLDQNSDLYIQTLRICLYVTLGLVIRTIVYWI